MKNSRRARTRKIEKSEEREVRARGRQNGRTCDSMRFTAALRRFIAPSKHKMSGKRACAWVHPHFTFTADCRLKPGNISPISCSGERSRFGPISDSLSLIPPLASLSKRGHWLSPGPSLSRLSATSSRPS